jgi:small-conductance mechanosensitive channel
MSVQDLVDRVVAVLSRAESLFTPPGEATAAARAAQTLTSAAETSRTIAARTDEMSGATASAHHDVLATAAGNLGATADTDARLTDLLGRIGQAHAAGAAQSTQLREGAHDVPSQLDSCAALPVGELATLMALRNQVADMGLLLADHTSQAAQATDDIVRLHYPQ